MTKVFECLFYRAKCIRPTPGGVETILLSILLEHGKLIGDPARELNEMKPGLWARNQKESV